MRAWTKGGRVLLVGSLLTFSCIISPLPAQAARAQDIVHRLPGRDALAHDAEQRGNAARDHQAPRLAHSRTKHLLARNAKTHYNSVNNLQCVPFARAASGIDLQGNAVNWWDAAEGVYQRGRRPEVGSVLNFRANGRMRLGHVAVVRRVVTQREIEIDQANWVAPSRKGNISRGTRVIDVSENNDWSAVRVQLVGSEDFGSVYPTYGFIYDRPDSGVALANSSGGWQRSGGRPTAFEEVAEAPERGRARSETLGVSFDIPNRSLR